MILVGLILISLFSPHKLQPIYLECDQNEYGFRPEYHLTSYKGHVSYVDGFFYYNGYLNFYHHVNYNETKTLNPIYWTHLWVLSYEKEFVAKQVIITE